MPKPSRPPRMSVKRSPTPPRPRPAKGHTPTTPQLTATGRRLGAAHSSQVVSWADKKTAISPRSAKRVLTSADIDVDSNRARAWAAVPGIT